jgi:putative ABC transport system permease protein
MRIALDDLRGDFRQGVRMLFREPGFSVVAALTLALGIGANTAIFSVVNTVWLRALPYPHADRLVVLDESRQEHGSRTVSWMDFRDWRIQNRAFDDLAAYRRTDVSLTGRGDAALLRAAEVSSAFFSLLGTQPSIGRLFNDEDDRPGAARTVAISHDFWETRLHGSPGVVGQSLVLNGSAYSVVGVVPTAFDFFDKPVDVYLPVGLHGAEAEWVRRGNHPDLLVLARLRSGMSVSSARTAFDTIMRRLESDYPQSNTGLTATVTDLSEFKYGSTRNVLATLLATVACVLLIACANVANLLLARASSRRTEMAVRATMGASRWRLARQVLAEATVLSVAGGALGLVVAIAARRTFIATAPASLSRVADGAIDGTVLAFTAAVSIASGLLFGSAPAMQVTWDSLATGLNETGRSAGASRRSERLRSGLLVCEMAMALLLLTGAGLLLRSLANAMKVDPGFAAEHLVTLDLTIPSTRYTEPQRKVLLLTQAVERLTSIAGVQAVGAAQCPPLQGVCTDTAFTLADHPVASVVDIPTAASNIVAPGYFETLRVPLLAGRVFVPSDDRRARLVAIVNHSFAAQHWPLENAIGKLLREGGPLGQQPYREIVGVVADVKQGGIDTAARPEVFLPVTQFPFAPWTELQRMTFVVRTEGDPLSVVANARRVLSAIDHDLPVTGVATMAQRVSESIERRSVSTRLLSVFGLLALLLAAVGTYGAMACHVAQRTPEIGVRMALGATPNAIRMFVVRQALSLAAVGIAVGWTASLLSARWVATWLFGVGTTDPVIFAGVGAVLVLMVLLASVVPVQRALSVEPGVIVRGN